MRGLLSHEHSISKMCTMILHRRKCWLRCVKNWRMQAMLMMIGMRSTLWRRVTRNRVWSATRHCNELMCLTLHFGSFAFKVTRWYQSVDLLYTNSLHIQGSMSRHSGRSLTRQQIRMQCIYSEVCIRGVPPFEELSSFNNCVVVLFATVTFLVFEKQVSSFTIVCLNKARKASIREKSWIEKALQAFWGIR